MWTHSTSFLDSKISIHKFLKANYSRIKTSSHQTPVPDKQVGPGLLLSTDSTPLFDDKISTYPQERRLNSLRKPIITDKDILASRTVVPAKQIIVET